MDRNSDKWSGTQYDTTVPRLELVHRSQPLRRETGEPDACHLVAIALQKLDGHCKQSYQAVYFKAWKTTHSKMSDQGGDDAPQDATPQQGRWLGAVRSWIGTAEESAPGEGGGAPAAAASSTPALSADEVRRRRLERMEGAKTEQVRSRSNLNATFLFLLSKTSLLSRLACCCVRPLMCAVVSRSGSSRSRSDMHGVQRCSRLFGRC